MFWESDKSTVGWSSADVWLQVVWPALPLVGMPAIFGHLLYFTLNHGDDEFGGATEAFYATTWGLLWQTIWLFTVVVWVMVA